MSTNKGALTKRLTRQEKKHDNNFNSHNNLTSSKEITQEYFCNGNCDPIKDVYTYYYPIICIKIRELKGNRDDAFDILHDVLLKILTRPVEEKIKLKKTFESYLIAACINRWKSERKKRNKQYITNTIYHENLLNEPQIDEAIEALKHALLQKHISMLGKAGKLLINLLLEGKSVNEITRIMKYKNVYCTYESIKRVKRTLKIGITTDFAICSKLPNKIF